MVAQWPSIPLAQENPYPFSGHEGVSAHERHPLAFINTVEAAGKLANDPRFLVLVVEHENQDRSERGGIVELLPEIVLVRPSGEVERKNLRMIGEVKGDSGGQPLD